MPGRFASRRMSSWRLTVVRYWLTGRDLARCRGRDIYRIREALLSASRSDCRLTLPRYQGCGKQKAVVGDNAEARA